MDYQYQTLLIVMSAAYLYTYILIHSLNENDKITESSRLMLVIFHSQSTAPYYFFHNGKENKDGYRVDFTFLIYYFKLESCAN